MHSRNILFVVTLRLTRSLGFLAGLAIGSALLAAPYPFHDSFESGLSNWTTNGLWGRTTSRFGSPTHSVTDTPGSFYVNHSDSSATLASSLNLSGALRPALSFQQTFFLEHSYDFAKVEVSLDGGASWNQPALAAYTGIQSEMRREQLDLTPYAGASNFRLRFRLITDGSVVMDGWYLDDIRVGETPAPILLNPPSATGPNAVQLSWTAATDSDFARYRILRSDSPDFDWRGAYVVAEIGDPSTSAYTDFTVAPKTTYYYRLMVLNTSDLHAISSVATITTPPGMDFPFLDNAEAGAAFWVADAPWALSDESAASGRFAWSDSPGADYANLIASQSLTLSAPVRLAGRANTPVLSFVHQFSFGPGDSGHVEVSVNNGADWASLATFTGLSQDRKSVV